MSIEKKLDAFIEKIQSETLEDIVSERFGRYSKYIIQDRALPDARDGLKPVQRRILYAMHQMGMFSNKPYKKSARIAGEVMGKYHPHGDSSIYEAMVRLSQDFKMRIPLIDMHGNNGSIDGDNAAAMRYTEARLSKSAESLLLDIDKRTVPFIPNFDDEEIEPTVLPAKFPNLLVNGATGISAGYATKIPPHNLNEVVLATIAYLDNENITFHEIAKIIKGPDFPTGGIVQGLEGILSALETGTGKVIIRAKATIEEVTKAMDRIIITEIPYEVNKADLVRQMDLLRIDKKVDDITEIRDESDKDGLRIAVDLKKGADAQFLLNFLYKFSDLQVSYNYNMVAILNHRPVLVGVLPIISAYINHQKEVITNRSNYELSRATKRQHIVFGLIKMVSIVDQIVAIIRKSDNKQASKDNIIEAFGFSDLQAEAIVTLQLYRLSNTDILALEKESQVLEDRIKDLNHILNSEAALKRVIKRELVEVIDQLGTPRRSEINEEIETIKIDQKELISDEKVFIGITKDGYVKRASLRSYQASLQPGLKADDVLIYKGEHQTLQTLLLFTNLGNYVFLPVYKIDEQKWKDLGVYLNNIVPIEKTEKIVKVLVVSTFDTNDMLLLATKSGMMKQSLLKDFEVSRYHKPIRAMKVSDDDELISVDLGQKENILALSKKGFALRFDTQDLPSYGLTASGVKGQSLGDGDHLSAAIYVKATDEFMLLTNRGHVMKDIVSELPLYGRNRRGILIVETQKNNPHYIVGAARYSKAHIKDDVDTLMIGTKDRLVCPLSELKYSNNKFGKKILDEQTHGEGVAITIEKTLEPEDKEIQKPQGFKKETIKQEEKPVKEELVIKNDQKIRLSRLDLFEDDE